MKTLGRVLLLILCTGVAAYAASFLNFKLQGILLGKGTLVHSTLYLLAFYLHVGLGGLALVIGPWQFFPTWRSRRLALHRLLGKIYVSACWLSGLGGLSIAFFASGGPATKIGFTLLAIGWLITTTKAYLHIRQGAVEAHQQWMMRSFALTLAAVSLRLYLPSLMAVGLDFKIAYLIVSWACWIPNLLIAEWIIRQKQRVLAL